MATFKTISEQNWEQLTKLIEKKPKLAKEEDSDGYLPLHSSIQRNAPESILFLLLTTFPKATRHKTHAGDIPLHLALRCTAINQKFIEALLLEYPNSVKELDSRGNLPIHSLILKGDDYFEIASLIVESNPNCLKLENVESKLPIALGIEQKLSRDFLALLHERYPKLKKGLSYEQKKYLQRSTSEESIEEEENVCVVRSHETSHPSILEDSLPIFSLPYRSLVENHSSSFSSPPGSLTYVLRQADKLLVSPPGSVMDKELPPGLTDKHDFFSLATYFWPDPSKPDGLPYIRRDGFTNKANRLGTDANPFKRACKAVFTLGLAYWFTRDLAYASRAAFYTRTWFLDPATRMTPHLLHAQAIPGMDLGRGAGILQGRQLTLLLDGLTFISSSGEWSSAESSEHSQWLESYYHWITTSDHGRDAREHKNNHGTWYDVQVAHIALYLQKYDEALAVLERAKVDRISRQIEPDGSQPFELARTKSLNYSIFNLEALIRLATLCEEMIRLGKAPPSASLWDYRSPDGRSIHRALSFIAPYVDSELDWTYKADVQEADRDRIPPLLLAALRHVRSKSIDSTCSASEFSALVEDYPRLLAQHHSPDTDQETWNLWS